MKTTILIKIELPDPEFHRLECRATEINKWSLNLLEDIITFALLNELGVISKTTVTKIE